MQQLEKKHQLAILVIISIILFGAGFKYAQVKSDKLPSEAVLEKQSGEIAGKAKEIVVHVTKSVKKETSQKFSELMKGL